MFLTLIYYINVFKSVNLLNLYVFQYKVKLLRVGFTHFTLLYPARYATLGIPYIYIANVFKDYIENLIEYRDKI
jgi:hypothetical protein